MLNTYDNFTLNSHGEGIKSKIIIFGYWPEQTV